MKKLTLLICLIGYAYSVVGTAETVPDGARKDSIFNALFADISVGNWSCDDSVVLTADGGQYLALGFSLKVEGNEIGRNIYLAPDFPKATQLNVEPGAQPVVTIENFFRDRTLTGAIEKFEIGDAVSTLRVFTTPDHKRVTALTAFSESIVERNFGTVIDPRFELVRENVSGRIFNCRRQ